MEESKTMATAESKAIETTATKALSKATLDNKIKNELISEFEEFMTNKYGRCIKVIPYEDSTSAHNFSLASPALDETGRTVWVKVDVAIPRGNRSTNVYDGDEMASRYQQNVEQYNVKVANRATDKAKKEAEKALKKSKKAKKSKEATATASASTSIATIGTVNNGYIGTVDWDSKPL